MSLIATAGEQLCLRMTDASLRCGPREPHDTLPPRVLGAEGSEALTMTDDERRLHVCRLDSAGDAGCFGDLRLFGLTHTLGLDDRGLVPVPNGSGVAQLVLRGGSCDAVFARGTDGSVRVLARFDMERQALATMELPPELAAPPDAPEPWGVGEDDDEPVARILADATCVGGRGGALSKGVAAVRDCGVVVWRVVDPA